MRPLRFVGDTKKCFNHFVTKYPTLEVFEFVADVCRVNVPIVQRWQRGEYFPGGDALLRLRCLLHLAGYEVSEMQKLNGDVKSLALIVGLGVMDEPPEEISPEEISLKLGYEKLQSLWRILLRGGGYLEDVESNMNDLCVEYADKLKDKSKELQRRLSELTGESVEVPVPTEQQVAPLDPALATTFGRLVGATISLGRLLLTSGATEEVHEATHAGQDMAELKQLLQDLSATNE